MVDNITLPGTGQVVRTVANGSVETQVMKLDVGGEGGEVLVTSSNPMPVSGTVTTNPPANASTNISEVGGTALALGQTTMSASVPVALASNQSAIPVSGTVTTNPPANASANITEVGGAALAFGQATMAGSIPVALASNQSAVPVSGTVTTNPPANATTNISEVGGTALALGQTTMSASVPVALASNQSAIPVSGTVTVATGGATVVAGQAKLATAGTAVNLPAASLVNGVVITAYIQNTGIITVGGSSVNNTVNGTGNGVRLQPGQSFAYSVSNANDIWFNGTVAGDSIDYGGN